MRHKPCLHMPISSKAKARRCDASQLCGAGRTDKAEEIALHEGPAEDPVGPTLDARLCEISDNGSDLRKPTRSSATKKSAMKASVTGKNPAVPRPTTMRARQTEVKVWAKPVSTVPSAPALAPAAPRVRPPEQRAAWEE